MPFTAKVTYLGRERAMTRGADLRRLQRLPHAGGRERRARPDHAAVAPRAQTRILARLTE